MNINNKINFLFYDYETFGIHPALDKPSQFACIRTDYNLNIIGTEHYFYCFPPNDYLPDPEAVLLTGITPQYTQKNGLNEFFFARKIFKIFNVGNTCIIGYNNLKFDDEVTRNIFYRNFLDPYSWSWNHSNSRWDVICLIIASYVLTPNDFIWTRNKLGFVSFKLKDLAQNHHLYHNAHDALSDVYATIAVMRFIKKKKPELFNFLFQYRLKNNLRKLIRITFDIPVIYIASFFGFSRNYITCILPLFWSIHNCNNLIFCDLHTDVYRLINYLRTTSIHDINIKKLYNFGISILNINKCPILLPINLLTNQKLLRLGINMELYFKKIHYLKKNNIFFKKIEKFLQYYVYENITNNVDLKIYDAFFSQHDKYLMRKIHTIKINQWKNLTFNFHNDKLKEMFFRIRARNFPELLDASELLIWKMHLKKTFSKDYLNKYFLKLQSLLNQYHHIGKEYKLLSDLKKYVDLLIAVSVF